MLSNSFINERSNSSSTSSGTATASGAKFSCDSNAFMSSSAFDARSLMSVMDLCNDFHHLHTHLKCNGLHSVTLDRISIIRSSGRIMVGGDGGDGDDDGGVDSSIMRRLFRVMMAIDGGWGEMRFRIFECRVFWSFTVSSSGFVFV
ncbi:hypothetical protein Lal_00044065 [Lupinus albus]|nr:hypothetical protein Lal_00044065 [Lupinus albus]